MKPLITVIIPIYNSEKTIEKCVNSIINQSYKNIEVILVNDGSTDKSSKICEEFANKDCRIKVFHIKNSGTSTARNIGIKNAKGDFIQFVDSDDWIESRMCKVMLDRLTTHEVDTVICGLNINKNGILIRKPSLPNKDFSVQNDSEAFMNLLKIFSSPCNKLYKTSLITKEFNVSLKTGEDFQFNLDYIKNTKKISIINDSLYNVSLDNENSLNKKFTEQKLDNIIYTRFNLMNYCDEIYGENYDKYIIYNQIILSSFSYLKSLYANVSKLEFMKSLKNYLRNSQFKEATNNSKLQNFKNNFYLNLLKLNNKMLIYYFFGVENKFGKYFKKLKVSANGK